MKKKFILYPLVMIILIAIDFITKQLATTYLKPIGHSSFIPGLELVYVLNEGVAFSMFSGSWFMVVVLPLVTVFVLIVLLFMGKLGGGYYDVFFLMIISGGLGNLIDRILYGHVVDFFNFTFIDFAVFNVADCYITIGVALYAVYMIVSEIKVKKEKVEQS